MKNMNMRVEADVWHARLYLWGFRIWQTFASSCENIVVSPHINICQYVRVLVLAAMACVGYLFVTAYIGAAFIYYPSLYFGWDYWVIIGKVGITLAVLALCILCIVVFQIGVEAALSWWKKKPIVIKKLEVIIEGTPNRPSIVAVAKKYVESTTEGFCASIEIIAPTSAMGDTHLKNIKGFDVFVPVVREENTHTEKQKQLSIIHIASERIPFLPVWWQLMLLFLVSAFFLLVFTLAYESKQDIQATWEGECSLGTWEKKSSKLQVNLTCNGKEKQVQDVETLISYINSLKKPRCFSDIQGEIYCDLSDQKRMKKKGE